MSAPRQAVRVAVPGEALVVVKDDRDRIAEGGRLLEDDLPDPGVLDDGPPLGRGEGGRLLEDLLGDRDLADVVEEGRDPDPVDLLLGQPEVMGQLDDDRGDERRRLAAVVGQRGDDGGEGVLGRVAGGSADFLGPARPAVEMGARGTRASSSGSANTYVWLRPRAFAEYIAASASRTSSSTRRSLPSPPAMPIETVTLRSGLPSTPCRARWTRSRSFSARAAASSTPVSVRSSMNSSPP
jgi:hypothetical protein